MERARACLPSAASQLENVRALIVGGTEGDVKRLRSEVNGRGWKNVEVIGYVAPDQIPLYQVAADVVVLPNSAKSENLAFAHIAVKTF